MKRAIEESFPIVEINRLAVPERNAFKPIYQMHKWFARRSSSVFRAILLGALKPAGTDIMAEFYRDHSNDPDTNAKVILDPFMGGGTTIVEALRLGCKVVGIDLNPVAWFIVKTEGEPVDLHELRGAFDRLAGRQVPWSGMPLKQALLDLYKTECPGCGSRDADIIYTFWVKSAPCTTAVCNHTTPLFSDYIIAQKPVSIRYLRDCTCPSCGKTFDWEREPASLVAQEKLQVVAGQFSAGEGRTSARWSYASGDTARCPWCSESVKPKPAKDKLERKKLSLTVLLCPHCEEVWQFRGPLPEQVQCPTCGNAYDPTRGNMPEKGKFVCRGTCNGNKDAVIAAIRTLPEEQLLPTHPYALEGYCPHCAKNRPQARPAMQTNLLEPDEGIFDAAGYNAESLIWKNHGKFFKRIAPADLARFQEAAALWEREKDRLPYPKSEIPVGAETKRLLEHHYLFWQQMFNPRQLLALSTLLEGIEGENEQICREMMLSAFQNLLNNTSDFTSYRPSVGAARQVFARHDFQPKMTPCEINVWGIQYGMGSFTSMISSIYEGKKYNHRTYDRKIVKLEDGECKTVNSEREEKIAANQTNALLLAQSSKNQDISETINFIITDPPYSGNVNYSELADFFYVWLRLLLKKSYAHFAPEITPKSEEVIENPTRKKTSKDYQDGLCDVFKESHRHLDDDGLLVFTFHHAEDSAWEALLNALCNAGFYIEAVYPIHGESESSLHLMDKDAISYDLIHVCRKRPQTEQVDTRSWAGIRQEIRRRAREEARLIESGRYGKERLSPADITILLIGKCLELYSRHFGGIVDHEDQPVPIHRALAEIRMLVDQILSRERPLPPELETIDIPSYIYFTALCRQREIKSDDISKSMRGMISVEELKKAGLIIKGREKRGRTFEVKQPLERLNELKEKFSRQALTAQMDLFAESEEAELPGDLLLVDCVHLLLGLAEAGENVLPWLERLRGLRPRLRAGLLFLREQNKNFAAPIDKILGLVDERTLFSK